MTNLVSSPLLITERHACSLNVVSFFPKLLFSFSFLPVFVGSLQYLCNSRTFFQFLGAWVQLIVAFLDSFFSGFVELHLKLTQVLHLKVTHLEEPECPSSNKWDRCLVLLRAYFAHHFHVTQRVVDSANDVSR